VICGINGASESVAAARVAARRSELPLLYVHVLDEPGNYDEAEQLFRVVEGPDPAELAIESGHPADCLVTLARVRQASFVVVGNHGPRASLLGSISADIARRASCPVVVVPPTADVARRHGPAAEPATGAGPGRALKAVT
jgi:nucleotide-binding universal stress UspA family protein